MMEAMRFIRTNYTYTDFSTSISPAVEKALGERKSGNTLILNMFNKDSFIVGSVRASAGGAILLYLDTSQAVVPVKTIKDAFPAFLGAMADTMKEHFKINAKYSPLNNIEVKGRKIVPASAWLKNKILTMHLMINVLPANPGRMRNPIILKPAKAGEKNRKSVKDVDNGFTCLEQEVKRKIIDSDLINLARGTIERVFGNTLGIKPGELTEIEKSYASQLQRVK